MEKCEASYIAYSTIEAKYVATFEAKKEVIWLHKFLIGLGVVFLVVSPPILFCDNSEVVK